MKTFQKIMDGVTFVEKIIMTILLAVISVVTLGSVISRFTPMVSWSFTEELVINLFVPLSLLGAAICAREEGGLISMSLFTGFLPRKGQRWMNVLMCAFGLFFCVMMIKYGWAKGMSDIAMNKLTYVLRMKIGWFTTTIPICFSMMALHLVEFAAVNIDYAIKGEPEEEVEA